MNYSWQSERLVVLLWALGKFASLPSSATQCDTAVFREVLPPYVTTSAADIVRSAKLLDDDTLLQMADKLLDDHWQARDASLNGRKSPDGIDIEIVQERHHAINWIIGYEGLPWDEVTTDT
jgi:hypothetical protein